MKIERLLKLSNCGDLEARKILHRIRSRGGHGSNFSGVGYFDLKLTNKMYDRIANPHPQGGGIGYAGRIGAEYGSHSGGGLGGGQNCYFGPATDHFYTGAIRSGKFFYCGSGDGAGTGYDRQFLANFKNYKYHFPLERF